MYLLHDTFSLSQVIYCVEDSIVYENFYTVNILLLRLVSSIYPALVMYFMYLSNNAPTKLLFRSIDLINSFVLLSSIRTILHSSLPSYSVH